MLVFRVLSNIMDYLFFVQYDASYSEEYVYIILSTTIKLNKYVEFQFFFILPGNAKSSKGTKILSWKTQL